MTPMRELQCQGLPGPTHNYAGLGLGNLASQRHAGQNANPREAALQALATMRWLHERGVPVAILPPHPRPRLDVLRTLGFHGPPAALLKQAYAASPGLLRAVWSASAMWSANAATVTPAGDSADGQTHLTPANLLSSLHRLLEARETASVLRQVFADSTRFSVHDPLPVTTRLADEGAANHMRLCDDTASQPLHLFTYGAAPPDSPFPVRHMPRQQRAASEAIAQKHQIDPARCLYAQQHPDAIDAGVFHHDVIGMSHHHLLIVHARAWCDQPAVLENLRRHAPWLHIREISEQELPLSDAVATYFFNAQLVSLPDDSIAMLLPHECADQPRAAALCERLQAELPGLSPLHFVNLHESMRNGGGPACLRLRVPLDEEALQAVHPGVRFSTKLDHRLSRFIESRYRDRVSPDDLLDAGFAEEALTCRHELLGLLGLNAQS